MRGSHIRYLPVLLLTSLVLPGPARGLEEEAVPALPEVGYSQVAEEWEGDFLYRVTFLRAAPGRQADLIELLKEERDLLRDGGEALPYWMRHTQGDQWDLMILYPIENLHDYYQPEKVAARDTMGEWKGLSLGQLQSEADLLISYREEMFFRGPNPGVLEALFSENDFYHVEIFVALPGKRAELLEQRRMENRFLRALDRPENLIFVREIGGPWDSFTLGFYHDLQHYAHVSVQDPADEERAAVDAGFEGADRIGVYMRSLILYHNDTLAVSIPWW
jgi:hypothetical protein